MTDYTNNLGGAAKDAANDTILGSAVDTELDSLVTAIASKVNHGKIEPTGDTAASDNAALGKTTAEGLIVTGQGTTGDVAFVNDAGETVAYVPTGTQRLTSSAGNDIDSGLYAVKAADESVVNDTQQVDDDLVLTLEANAIYMITGDLLFLNASAGVDIDFEFKEADGTFDGHIFGGSDAGGTLQTVGFHETTGETLIDLLAGGTAHYQLRMTVFTGGAGGSFAFWWAQNVTDAGNATQVLANSFISALRIQ